MSRSSRSRALLAGGLLAGVAFGCSGEPDELDDPVARGRALFDSGALASSSLNLYRCTSCHDAFRGESERMLAGAPLAGVTERAAFWGGQENDLLRALEQCRTYFMYSSEPLVATSREARALYAYLSSLAPEEPEPVPFTVVQTVGPLPRGDAERGAALFERACSGCHGALGDGAGALSPRVPVLPEATLADHADYTPADVRLVFVEKVRHGGFFGYGGVMPPFSLEVLSDAELSDVLEALGAFGD